ncbi:MAG: hypothetical protein WCC01_09485 [Acidimicrobiia bacterium]
MSESESPSLASASNFNSRLESIASIVLAVAAVLTALAGFEAAAEGGNRQASSR